MNDIQHRQDVEQLIDAFYKQVIKDPVIGYIFNDVVKLDWKKHIPVMYDFWETILLGKLRYKGNPIPAHIDLNKKEKLQPGHFERWIQLWETTVRANFNGEKAEEAIKRSKVMGEMMQYKIRQSENGSFIQ